MSSKKVKVTTPDGRTQTLLGDTPVRYRASEYLAYSYCDAGSIKELTPDVIFEIHSAHWFPITKLEQIDEPIFRSFTVEFAFDGSPKAPYDDKWFNNFVTDALTSAGYKVAGVGCRENRAGRLP